jgi:hypothetical protein
MQIFCGFITYHELGQKKEAHMMSDENTAALGVTKEGTIGLLGNFGFH